MLWVLSLISVYPGATENAGVENAIRSKMQGWNMQEWKSREQIAGVEHARVENREQIAGVEMQDWKSREQITGLENA